MEGTNNFSSERPIVRASALCFVPERGKAFRGRADVKESPENMINLSGLELTVEDINQDNISRDIREKIEKLSKGRLTDSAIARKKIKDKNMNSAERA